MKFIIFILCNTLSECTVLFLDCSQPRALGMISGSIFDFDVTASSFNDDHVPQNARLGMASNEGWIPLHAYNESWLQVDFKVNLSTF